MTGTQVCMNFDGKTFEKEKDASRLRCQLEVVFHFMRDAAWRSLAEISERTGCPEASISARIRDLRKVKFGGHTVNRRRRHIEGIYGVWEYQLVTSYNGLN